MIKKLLTVANEPNEADCCPFSLLAQLLSLNTRLVCLRLCDWVWVCSHVHVHLCERTLSLNTAAHNHFHRCLICLVFYMTKHARQDLVKEHLCREGFIWVRWTCGLSLLIRVRSVTYIVNETKFITKRNQGHSCHSKKKHRARRQCGTQTLHATSAPLPPFARPHPPPLCSSLCYHGN